MTHPHDKPGVPPKRTGFQHLVHSTKYSYEGLKTLGRESAFRQELIVFPLVLLGHVVFGSPVWLIFAQIVAALILFAVEALNSAIEELVDHVSPDYSRMAKRAKDLGSFAVACLLLANGLIALATFAV